ncbi:hypothetical protein [Isoptericola sp. NPDC056134]|uniref:hypothetical protein n=1 Tax=Isoptericola sp. NPDC056134 TaxID=3345723 RepID=UPI0035EC4784
MSLDDMPLSTVLTELAETYETVVALGVAAVTAGGKATGKPGSRVPPGMSEVMDTDEFERAVREVDEWALYVGHHLLDVEPGIGSVPDSTPGRLRLAARWADMLSGDPDLMARYAFEGDARSMLTTMRRLSRRGTRRVRTGSACLTVTCPGQYVARIDEPDGDIECSTCHDRVSYDHWSRWGSQQQWVTVEHAANMAGTTVAAVKVRAHRQGWRRTGTGRDVKYNADDVMGRGGERSA